MASTLAASASSAADGYVPLEQRMTAEQRLATGHAFGVAQRGTDTDRWTADAEAWLRENGLL